MLEGSALDGQWTRNIPESNMYIIVMEGVLEYFSKEQVKTCLNIDDSCNTRTRFLNYPDSIPVTRGQRS